MMISFGKAFPEESVEEFRMIPSGGFGRACTITSTQEKKMAFAGCLHLFNILRGFISIGFVSFIGERYIDRQYHHTNNNNLIAGTPLYQTGSLHRQATGTCRIRWRINGQSAGRPDRVESSAGNGSVNSSFNPNNTGNSSVTVSGSANNKPNQSTFRATGPTTGIITVPYWRN